MILYCQKREVLRMPFYKNRWFWVVVFIFIVASVAGASNNLNSQRTGGEAPGEQVQTQQSQSVGDQGQPAQLQEGTGTKELSAAEAGPIKNQPERAKSFRDTEIYKSFLAKGQLVEAEPGKYYQYKKAVVLKNKDFLLEIVDFTAGYDITNIYAPCQLKVDVELGNFSNKTVYWSYRSFKAVDSQGYSYSPNSYSTRGDLYGDIPPRDLRKCQLSFDIPPIRQSFTLIYTDPDTGEQVKFILDINKREEERWQEYLKEQEKNRAENQKGTTQQEQEKPKQ
jgi:hypothetical protein